MLKIIYISLLLSALQLTAVCQPARRDSIIRAARRDAKNFRLDDTVWKKYKRKLPATSSYFDPVKRDKVNQRFIDDSLYVKTYRRAAYKHNRSRRTPLHYVLVGGGILAAVLVAAAITIVLVVGPTMN